MSPEKWQKIKDILADTLAVAPLKRSAFLDVACDADMEIRKEVESFLKFEEQEGSFLEKPAFESLNFMESNLNDIVGKKVGKYKIIRELGSGGMGAVFLAERDDREFTQKVAVKVVKQAATSPALLRRFQIERQILAELEHPYIARLINGGTIGDKLPYLVMEYVEGEPITEYVEKRELSLNERLDLFRKVCSAVAYAHRNLVVHLDLKPSNILVTKDGEPKLLDFGVAKLLKDEKTDQTDTHTFIFTPDYASPEQVRGEKLTTATDIYSLGIILYEMLTGIRPFKIEGQNIGEIIRAVSETNPTRPSEALIHQKTDAPDIEAKINAYNLKGDIDNIILKSLRKEPNRRYSSVEQFSEDIHRYLRGLPVLARPDTFTYRAEKFIGRNRFAVVAAGLLLLSLFGGLAATLFSLRLARNEGEKSERRFNEVRQLAHTVLFDYHDAIASLPGSVEIRARLVKDSLTYLNNLEKEVGDDRILQREIASAYIKIGDVQGGVVTTSAGNTLSNSNLGDTKGALENYNKAVAINEQLILLEPHNEELMQDLAKVYARLAQINASQGNLAATADYYRRGISIYEKLYAANPTDTVLPYKLSSYYFNLANTLGVPGVPNLGRSEEALEYLRKVLEIDEKLVTEDPTNTNYRQDLGTGYGNTGRTYYGTGNYKEALKYYRKAVENGEILIRENKTNALYQRELAVHYRNLGNALLATGKKTEAVESLRKAIFVFESLMTADLKDARIRRSAAYGYRDLGVALTFEEKRDEALKNLTLALSIFSELAASDEKNTILKQQIALTHLRLSEFFAAFNDLAKAEEHIRQTIEKSESLLAANAQDVEIQTTLANGYAQLGKYRSVAGKKANPEQSKNLWEEARNFYQKSLDIWKLLKEQNKLSGADKDKPDFMKQEIARCNKEIG